MSANENRIGSERTRLRLSQEELAEELEVTRQTISSWEQDKRSCPNQKLIQLALLFGCSTDYLLGITDERLGRRTEHTAQ